MAGAASEARNEHDPPKRPASQHHARQTCRGRIRGEVQETHARDHDDDERECEYDEYDYDDDDDDDCFDLGSSWRDGRGDGYHEVTSRGLGGEARLERQMKPDED